MKPICDFVEKYIESESVRLHMPGHKGKQHLGFEKYDITEISGADSLYEADGIILNSEKNAGKLFGAETFYSTEGSSLCIRAMLYLVILYAKKQGKNPLIVAGRNAHKTLIHSAALLDFDIRWMYGQYSYLSCEIDLEELKRYILTENPAAVYITSPDYLGNMLDVREIAELCHSNNTLLIVDNAHGAYLKFLSESKHPLDLGADMCCDSAHKTLPVLTGGAYLHISCSAPSVLKEQAKYALSLFGSTSPSYLLLQSLDNANKYLADGYAEKLNKFCFKVKKTKERFLQNGYTLVGDEPLKITVATKVYGYTGIEFADLLYKNNIVCEFCDPDFIVFMLTPEITDEELLKFENAMLEIKKKECLVSAPPKICKPEKVMSAREALFLPKEKIPVLKSLGKILASPGVSCPPAVPVLVCGERINEQSIETFKYYGISECVVVKE